MNSKVNIRTCRYVNCPFNHVIDLTKDSYKVEGKGMYYHTSCLEEKKKNSWKNTDEKRDLQYIKNQWVLHIDNTVVYSQLFRVLNELLSNGVPSDYLVFALDYVIAHHMKLRYPNGFKYYVNNDDIKAAYKKKKIAEKGIKPIDSFTAIEKDDAPKFSIQQKQSGFGSILKGGDDN